MPVAMSVHWKPLRDPHYVVASLQPGGGGRREIFITQDVLSRILSLSTAPAGVEVRGLLVGQRFNCTISPSRYLVIDTMVEVAASMPGENALAAAAAKLTPGRRGFDLSEALGWYYRTGTPELRMSEPIARAHIETFPHPWQTTLIITENARSGGFYLADVIAQRWYLAPFYEIIESKAGKRAEKPTCVAWEQYLTADRVVYIEPPRPTFRTPQRSTAVTPAGPIAVVPSTPRAVVAVDPPALAPALASALKKASDATRRLVVDTLSRKAATVRGSLSTSAKNIVREATATVKVSTNRITEIRAARAAQASERAAAEKAERVARENEAARRAAEAADRKIAEAKARHERERQAAEARAQQERERRAAEEHAKREAEKLAEQQAAETLAKQQAQQVAKETLGDGADAEDTTARDRPYRYLALARREGFVVDASYERGDPAHPETLWVLNEPETGLFLTVVTSDTEIREANLQYNLHVDDLEILEAAPPEERDMTTHTLHFREPCANRLRARVRRLKATGALEREWKVGYPGIGPDEWGVVQGIHLADEPPSPISQNGSRVDASDAHPG